MDDVRELMSMLAAGLDGALNEDLKNRKVGFALLTYEFGANLKGTGLINYVGNGKREDVLIVLKELVARWEGRTPISEEKH